jgi:hypothetical protein
VTAGFNLSPTPLSLTALVPASAVAGGTSFTLSFNGAGFTPASVVMVNGQSRAATFVSSTQLQVQILASDIATPGAFQVAVANAPSGSSCAALALGSFFVTQ